MTGHYGTGGPSDVWTNAAHAGRAIDGELERVPGH